MSAWTSVVQTGRRNKDPSPTGISDARNFLSRFKTSPCAKPDFHDHRQCEHYHSHKDKRRNPYSEFYLPDDKDIQNPTETMYHPKLFRTQLCDQPFDCPFGKYCARAHEKSLVRNVADARHEYSDHASSIILANKMRHTTFLGTHLPKQLGNKQSSKSDKRKWNVPVNHNQPRCAEYLFELSRDSKPWFLLTSSSQFFSFLQELALKEGLTQLEIRNNCWGDGEFGIAIRGNKETRDDVIVQIATYLFDPPAKFFVEETKSYSKRVVTKLSEKPRSEIYETILGKFSDRAFIEFYEDKIMICASNHPYDVGKQIVFNVFEKLTFWVKQEGHDKFIDCCCCMDSYNHDEGVLCAKGHFYCGGIDGCIGAMVQEQLQRIQHQENVIICSICETSIDTQSLAPFLPETTWSELEETRIDSKVKVRTQQLSHDFDKRLEGRIEEFMGEYGSLDGRIKLEARRHAKYAQDVIMNLKCPHCSTPYAEFDGCMAIQCGTCKKSFCGYCHHGTETARGAHDHVRECLVNDTNNGSYYATPEQVKVAQRKHRTRELKKFLQPMKMDIQNATVLELERDLEYHDIEKAALFEFGNLQLEM